MKVLRKIWFMPLTIAVWCVLFLLDRTPMWFQIWLRDLGLAEEEKGPESKSVGPVADWMIAFVIRYAMEVDVASKAQV